MKEDSKLAPVERGQAVVLVSDEMTALVGRSGPTAVRIPHGSVAIGYHLGRPAPASLALGPTIRTDDAGTDITLFVAADALQRLCGEDWRVVEEERYHLPSALRSIALALAAPSYEGEALSVYRIGKSIELLCETLRLLSEGELIPMGGGRHLSRIDSERLASARRLIDERWNEKLTIETVARHCGLNRAKLTRGFRETFGCSVAEALAERRLHAARRMLLATDLPVSSIGYKSGYLNNASFTRAFSRRFGLPPSGLRASGIAA
jgi:AraC family transcriptional regulator, transcriptional activator of the genes for pyochelin and ferripyochelin receptors